MEIYEIPACYEGAGAIYGGASVCVHVCVCGGGVKEQIEGKETGKGGGGHCRPVGNYI